MSLPTWRKEFYPVTAKSRKLKGDDIAQTEHALHKWSGLLPQNMDKHLVQLDPYTSGALMNATGANKKRAYLFFSDSCALCANHYERSGCPDCPIVKATGSVCYAEHATFYWRRNPLPMIKLLQRTLKWLKRKKRAAK